MKLKSIIKGVRSNIKLDYTKQIMGRRFYHDDRILYMVTGELSSNIKDAIKKGDNDIKKIVSKKMLKCAEYDFYYYTIL